MEPVEGESTGNITNVVYVYQADAAAMAKELAMHAKFKAERKKLSKERRRLQREVSRQPQSQMYAIQALPTNQDDCKRT